MLNKRTCGECALRQQTGGVCPLFNKAVSADEGGCPSFTGTQIFCELCHNLIIGTGNALIDITIPGETHSICKQCQKLIGHCNTCRRASACAFETDPSDLPKVIQQQVRQGNMISVMTVKNPSRIDITCKKGCPCFDSEIGCLRESNNSCGNYKIVYDNLP